MVSVDASALERPIRVVMFGSGPELTPDAKVFLCRLHDHPEIELLGAFCQAKSRSPGAVFLDLWMRRKWLAIPLFGAWMINKVFRFLSHPRQEMMLKTKLKKISDRVFFVPNIHAQDVLNQVCALQPDLGLVYGSPILKPELFEIPRLGTLGIHHGKVPEYRGNKTTFWAMYNGEPYAGVTIQKVNKGLDTGSIVKAGEVKVSGRSYPAVVQELEKLGLDLYLEAILEVKQGIAEFTPQPGARGRLYRNPKLMDFIRLWIRQIKRRLRLWN